MPSPMDHGQIWVIMNGAKTSDGMGGYKTTWTEGAEFIGTASLDSSVEAVVAEKTQGYVRMHLQVDKSVPIEINNYIKRKSDGETFQVKSDPDENATPSDAGLQFKEADIVKAPLPK